MSTTQVTFLPGTPEDVQKALLIYMDGGTRLRLEYGNAVTGQSQSDEFDSDGYIRVKPKPPMPFTYVPILLDTIRSTTGPEIRTDRIVAIWVYGKEPQRIYKHPNYRPKFDWLMGHVARKPQLTGEREFDDQLWYVWAPSFGTTPGEPCDASRKSQPIKGFGTSGQAARWLEGKKRYETI